MKNIEKDLIKSFNNVIKKNDDVIVIQSDLINTSLYYEIKLNKILEILYLILKDLSKDKTILFPAFSNSLILNNEYDEKLTNCYTGSLPNYLLKKEETKRTKSALHSFICIGPHTDNVTNLHQKTTWGKDSAFEWIEKKNAKWIALNLNWSRGCALYHRAEEIVGVPYRFFKKYKGKYFYNKRLIGNFEEIKYSYYLGCKPKFNYNKWPTWFNKDKKYYYERNRGLFMNIAYSKNIVETSVRFFKENPFNGLENENFVKSWLKDKQYTRKNKFI